MSYFIVNTAVANVYRDASHSSAVVTQALMGESCRILDYRDDWYYVRQWDGYEGWIYFFYGVESKEKYAPTMVSQDLFGTIISLEKDKMVSHLLFGSTVQAQAKHDGHQITLPDGRKGLVIIILVKRIKISLVIKLLKPHSDLLAHRIFGAVKLPME